MVINSANYRSQTDTYNLDAANPLGIIVPVFGNWIQVSDASSANAMVEIETTGEDMVGDGFLELQQNDYLKTPSQFKLVKIRWNAQPGAWVKLLVVNSSPSPTEFEYYRAPRGTIDSIAQTVQVQTGGGNRSNVEISVNTGGVKLLDARPKRTDFLLVNRGTTTIFIGGPGVTTATGIPVGAGIMHSENFTGELWGVALSGTQNMRVTEVWR